MTDERVVVLFPIAHEAVGVGGGGQGAGRAKVVNTAHGGAVTEVPRQLVDPLGGRQRVDSATGDHVAHAHEKLGPIRQKVLVDVVVGRRFHLPKPEGRPAAQLTKIG